VALAEFREARAWYRRDNPAAADDFRDAVFRALQLLSEQPLLGPERPELGPPPPRILVVRGFPYLLAYRVRSDGGARILRVLHTSRDIPSLLRPEVR
jgi:toxin ParE1/3/4